MRRKRVYLSISLSPGVIWLFVSLFIGAINADEIKENSGVNYDSSNKGVTVYTGGFYDLNLNSRDAENLNFNMDSDRVVISELKLWDFKDTVTFDVIQNEKVKVIFDPTSRDGHIRAQLHTFGCHGNTHCPSLSQEYFHRGEQTYVLFEVHPGDQDHWLAICVGGLLAILTVVVLMVTLYRKWSKHKTDCCKTRPSEETCHKDPTASSKTAQNQRNNNHCCQQILSKSDYLETKEAVCKVSSGSDHQQHACQRENTLRTTDRTENCGNVKMRDSGQVKSYSSTVFLAVCTGLFCLLMVVSVVWLGRSSVGGRRPEKLSVLKISIPSETKVRHIRSYSESPEITDVDLGQDRSMSLLTRLQFLDLSSECRYNLTMCRTHALCDSTNPEAGLQCRCNRGFFLEDLTCVTCKTSCETGFYMTQQCGATNDVVCKPCTVCSGTTYAAAQCTSTQDTICIDVTFPIRQFTEKLQTSDDQLLLNYTVADNVFLEQLYKIRQLQESLPMMSNGNQFEFTFDRPSGLAVKIKVKDIFLVPEYIDFDHEDDIEYVMNHRGFPQDIKDRIANVVENYCSHPLPNEYDLHLNIIRNISTAAAEIICDSKNDKLPACPSGYKDGDRYIYQFLSQPCRKAQESKNTFREHSNNIVCADNPEILSKVFHVAVQNSDPLTFPSDQCKNFAADCKRCLSQSSCTGSHCCADIECYARTSCRNLYTSVCPVAPVQCTRGDISKLSIIPRYSNIHKEFSCHLQHHPPKFLYVFNFTISIPKLDFEFPNRTKEMPFYNISHQEEGSDVADYLIVSHHTDIPMRDEVMLIGTFGEKNVDFSLHRLKKSKEFDRNLAFNIRRKSSTSMRTRVQFEKPFLYSTSSWGPTTSWVADGCDKNVSQIIAPQPLYHTQGQPLKQMSRKKKDTAAKQDGGQGKFVYELLMGQTSPHIKFTIPENVSLLSYYKNDLNGSQLENETLRADMAWDRHTLYWNITITGSITACPGYFTVEIYKGTPMTRLAVYDMLVTCQKDLTQKNFTLRYFITHHESVDIPDIFTVVLNDSVTSYRLLLSSVRGPQLFQSHKVAMTTTETQQASPWIPIIVILIVCSIVCISLLIVYAYCDNKQRKGVPPDITMPKPDLGAQITLLQNMDVFKPEVRSTLKSKFVVFILGVLYVIYALSFTFLMLFGLLHLMQGPQFGELGIGSNTSAKIQSKVQSHLNDMVYYETNETTRLVDSTQQRLTACSNHLKTSLYGLIPENTNAMRKSLRKVFEHHGTVHSLLKEYFEGRLEEYQPQIQRFIDEFNQTLDRHLHEFQINYKNYLKSIADNPWLEFPKQVFLEQERQEGRRFGAVDDNNRANFLTWLEIDKVQEMITVKDILMNRMLSMMPKVNFSELLRDLDSELVDQDGDFSLHENWIKFTSSSVNKYKIEVLKTDTDNQTSKENAKSDKDRSSIKSIIYPLFIGVFFLLDAFLLIYRFSWMARCVKLFKKGIEQRVPFDSITRKIHFILTGKDIPKEGENLEYPYDCALEALNRNEDIWGDNKEKYFIYCQPSTSAKSREDILKEIFKDRQSDKPKIEKQVTPQTCCCVHFIVKGLQLLYRMFISPIFWRFVLICGFVLLLCLVTKATNDLVTMESAMFLLDTDAVWPVMARQEVLTNQVISRQGVFLNSFLENYKNFVDVEIQILNSIIIAGTKNQSQLLNSMISDLCNISVDGRCSPSLGVDLVVPTLTSCNFLPLQPNLYSGFHRAIMSEYIRSALLPLISNLRSIMFSAFYLLLTFISAMLVFQISARVIFVYLLKSRHLRTTKIYQLSSCLDQDQQDFTIKDMYEGQSLVAESCESGVYDMTS